MRVNVDREIRVYTVCHSSAYFDASLDSTKLRMITAKLSGVRTLRIFTVFPQLQKEPYTTSLVKKVWRMEFPRVVARPGPGLGDTHSMAVLRKSSEISLVVIIHSKVSPVDFQCTNELQHNKTKWSVCLMKTRISLCILAVWSDSSLSVWRHCPHESFGSKQHKEWTVKTDQTGQMLRLISLR